MCPFQAGKVEHFTYYQMKTKQRINSQTFTGQKRQLDVSVLNYVLPFPQETTKLCKGKANTGALAGLAG